MGSGASKKQQTTNKHRNLTRCGNCECIAYTSQASYLSNRHVHAYNEGRNLIIVDVNFHKTITINDVFSPLHDLKRSKYAESVGLEVCNVIAFQWDVSVVQVFHREYTRFYVCDCTKGVCIAMYTKTFGVLGLCESIITADRAFMIIKQNLLHWRMYMGRSSEESLPPLELVSIPKQENGRCELIESVSFNTELAMCSHPQKTRVYFAYISNLTEKPIILGHNLKASKPLQELLEGLSGIHRFLNLQISKPGDLMFLSVIGGRTKTQSFVPAVCQSFNVMLQILKASTLEVLRTLEYMSYNGIHMYAPVISPSGQYISVNGQVNYIAPKCGSVKSLKVRCEKLLTELVLPEDIQSLPLPNSLKHIIMFGTKNI